MRGKSITLKNGSINIRVKGFTLAKKKYCAVPTPDPKKSISVNGEKQIYLGNRMTEGSLRISKTQTASEPLFVNLDCGKESLLLTVSVLLLNSFA